MTSHVGVGDILGHLLLWVVISILTLGIGLFFYPYSFAKFVLNRTVVHTDAGKFRMHCDLDVFSQLGHIILWILISLITFGLGYFFYLYKVWKFAAEKTTLSLT